MRWAPAELIDFNSPESQAKQGAAYQKVIHVFAGLYLWEFLVSLDFEWRFLSGRRRFRWPLIIYFAARYMMLGYVVALMISVDVPSRLDCQSLMSFLGIAADTSVGLSSFSLALRAIAVWGRNRYVVGVVAIMTLGHWSLILQGGRIIAEYMPAVQGCAITSSDNKLIIATMIYSMCYDAIVMCLVTWHVAFPKSVHTDFVRRLHRDGITYFITVFLVTCLGTIILFINMSPLMNAIFLSPGAIITTVAASRAVRRLNNFYGTSTSEEISTIGEVPSFRLTSMWTASRVQIATDLDRVDSAEGVKDSTGDIASSIHYDAHAFPPGVV